MAIKKKRKGQTCTLCNKPSVPGLLAGLGKCKYHWNVGVWGKKWADHVRKLEG